MVSSKTQKRKSDQETIIDMEPVKEEHKKSFLKNSNFIIIFSSLIITIISILWLIFYYLPNFYQLKNNKIAVCYLNGEFTVKRVKIDKDHIYLVPENDKYEPIKVTDENEFIVWGIVTYVIKKI